VKATENQHCKDCDYFVREDFFNNPDMCRVIEKEYDPHDSKALSKCVITRGTNDCDFQYEKIKERVNSLRWQMDERFIASQKTKKAVITVLVLSCIVSAGIMVVVVAMSEMLSGILAFVVTVPILAIIFYSCFLFIINMSTGQVEDWTGQKNKISAYESEKAELLKRIALIEAK